MLSRIWVKPNFGAALAQGGIAIVFAIFLALPIAWQLTAQVTHEVLTIGGVPSILDPNPSDPVLYVKAAEGDITAFNILLECSGLATVAIFGFLLAATMGLLQGPFWFKASWATIGTAVGVFWNVNRLVLSASAAHYVGMEAFSLVHYIFSPMVDFLWMVVVWSVGMSLMSRWSPGVVPA